MKSTFKFLLTFSLLVTIVSCKKNNVTISDNPKTPNDKTRATGSHVGISSSSRYYKYSGMPGVYTPFNGSAGNNSIRNASTGAVLPNVTGITTDHAFPNTQNALCLSRPNNTSNWQVWKFPISDPNVATLSGTIPNSASKNLSDLEYDNLYDRFYCLNRVSTTATNAVELSSSLVILNEVAITIIPNVDGLSLKPNAQGPGVFVSGQSAFGNVGYISMLKPSLTPFPGWTTANSIYTTATTPVPYAVSDESGLMFDVLDFTGNNFIVCASSSTNGNSWTVCSPIIFGAGAIIPNWVSSTRLVDLSAYN